MKRILINATQNEEIRVALCKGNHLYDFDLENRTREQKKSNIYKGHVTRVEPSLEAVFVEYGSARQGFLPIREIANEYLKGNARDENIRKLIKEGDELIVQVEKEERGNKGAALSTYVSLAGRYLVLMPNNPRGGGISRQISGKLREDMKRILANLDLPKGMSVIVRTAGIGKTQDDLQHDLNHLLNIWQNIQDQNQKYPSPRLVHQEAGVVTRAVRDYLRDDISEIWIDNENAYIEAAGFIDAVMPKQADKLRKYTDYEPMFSRFGIEKQIETAYQREVRLPSGGSIVIDQTEALVSIDINSAKSTKGADVAETAYHTNLEAADEIARQLRLRDMGGLIVIDFIDMSDNKHQREVEKRLVEATKYDRARVQFGEISRFGLLEMSRQRLRPSLEEATGYICPRCHGNGMIRDLRSLSLSIMRQIEQIALKERQGEVQAEVPTDIAAFLLNEKRDSLVYLEQDSGTRITILPHAHLESPNFKLHFNRDGFAPSSYERITDTHQQESSELGYDVDWQTADIERAEHQPVRQPRSASQTKQQTNGQANNQISTQANAATSPLATPASTASHTTATAPAQTSTHTAQPQAVAWLSNLFAPTAQAKTANSIDSQAAAQAIEALVNTGAQSLGALGQVDNSVIAAASNTRRAQENTTQENKDKTADNTNTDNKPNNKDNETEQEKQDRRRRHASRRNKTSKSRNRRDKRDQDGDNDKHSQKQSTQNRNGSDKRENAKDEPQHSSLNSQKQDDKTDDKNDNSSSPQRRPNNNRRNSRGEMPRGETLTPKSDSQDSYNQASNTQAKAHPNTQKGSDLFEVTLQVNEAPKRHKTPEVVHLSLDDSKTDDSKTAASSRTNDGAKNNADKSTVDKNEIDKNEADQGAETKATAKQHTETADRKTATSNDSNKAQDSATPKNTNSSPKPDDATDDSNNAIEVITDNPEVDSNVDANTNASSKQATADNASANNDSNHSKGKTQDEVQSNHKVGNQRSTEQTTPADKQHEKTLTPAYDAKALFAERYAAAKKYGIAKNDPRAVKAKQGNQPMAGSYADDAVANTQPTLSKVQGTVGEFINSVLPDAKDYLANRTTADDKIITGFIKALNYVNDNAKNQKASGHATKSNDASANSSSDSSNNKSKNTAGANSSSEGFNFSNYGYEPLDSAYLGNFNRMTQAVRQVAIAQGKTSVSSRPVTRRASNDPRGQHPEFKATTAHNNTSKLDNTPSPKSEHELETKKASALTDEHKVKAVFDDSQAMLSAETSSAETQNQAERANPSDDAVIKAHTADITDNNEQINNVQSNDSAQGEGNINGNGDSDYVDSHYVDSDNTVDADSDDVSTEINTEEAIQQPQASFDDLAKQKTNEEEGNSTPSKTTIASYKNMIENVAEQLLPQTNSLGLFNLTTPKIPRTRSRKAKTEAKKSAQTQTPQHGDDKDNR